MKNSVFEGGSTGKGEVGGLVEGGERVCRRMKAILVIIQLIVVIHQSFLEIKVVSLIISTFIALLRIDIELVH